MCRWSRLRTHILTPLPRILAISENGTALRDRAGTTLYLVRHGQTAHNRERIVQGRRIDSTLDATGRRQAEALARRFADAPLDALYASPLRRARQTVRVVAEQHPRLDVRYDEDLEEISWGCFEGEPTSEAMDGAFGDVRADWRDGHFDRAVEGGESVLDVQKRALRVVRGILDAHAGGTVLAVAHGRFLRILIASLLEEEYGLMNMHRVEHDNTGVNRLTWDADGACTAPLMNCTAHLGKKGEALVE